MQWIVPSGYIRTSRDLDLPMMWRFINETDVDIRIDRSFPDFVDRVDQKFTPSVSLLPRSDPSLLRNKPTVVEISFDTESGANGYYINDELEARILIILGQELRFWDTRIRRREVLMAAREFSQGADIPGLVFPKLTDQASIVLAHETAHGAYKLAHIGEGHGYNTLEWMREEVAVMRTEMYYVRMLQRGRLPPLLTAAKEHHQIPLWLSA